MKDECARHGLEACEYCATCDADVVGKLSQSPNRSGRCPLSCSREVLSCPMVLICAVVRMCAVELR